VTDCVIVQPIAAVGLDLLRSAGLKLHVASDGSLAALAPHLATARAVVTRDAGFSAEAIALSPHLRVIGVHGTGTNAVAKDEAGARGIAVVNTPGANAQSVAELTLALMLACTKQIVEADRAVRAGDFAFRYRQKSHELQGQTLGLVGFGHVSRRVARLARAFDMEVLGWSRSAQPGEMAEHGILAVSDLDDLCRRSDLISLHGIPGPTPLFDAAQLARVKPGAIIVNTGRGGLLDETALVEALTLGRIGAAGLDVYQTEPLPADNPLTAAPNVVLTPHLGGATQEALERTALEVASKVIAALGLPAWREVRA
jgi:D-3-phosphoglycerate dehydrogenase